MIMLKRISWDPPSIYDLLAKMVNGYKLLTTFTKNLHHSVSHGSNTLLRFQGSFSKTKNKREIMRSTCVDRGMRKAKEVFDNGRKLDIFLTELWESFDYKWFLDE